MVGILIAITHEVGVISLVYKLMVKWVKLNKTTKQQKMNSNLKLNAYVTLSLGAFLTCTVTLVFSWHILSFDPRLNNYAAVLGYTVSIFGLASALCGIFGAVNYKASAIIISCVINCCQLGLILPTIGCHTLLLICKSNYQGAGVVDDVALYNAAQRPWLYGTQIVMFALLQLTTSIATMIGYNLFKVIDIHKRLSRKFETLITQQQTRQMLYTRQNYEDLIVQKV